MEYERRVTHRAYVSAGLVALLALGWTTAQPKPWLGISVAPSSQEYGEALADAVRAGSQVYELPQQWKESGSSPNRELLPLVTRLVAAHELRVVLTLNPLDTATNQIPDDLRSRPLDHPESVHRYRRFVDATLASTSELRLLAIAVGNEVDVLLGDDANKWSEYARFFRNARKYLREKAPGGASGRQADLRRLDGPSGRGHAHHRGIRPGDGHLLPGERKPSSKALGGGRRAG